MNKELAQILILTLLVCPAMLACELERRHSEDLEHLTDQDRADLEQLLETL